MPNVSMREVAAYAGVSTATVSHVINNTRFVSEETRQCVLDAIQKLNYAPNAVARTFRTGRKNIIGFIIPDISNPFFSTLIEEVENVLRRQNYRLLVANSHEDVQREIENIRIMSSGVVDGLLVASALHNYDELQGAVPDGFPMVFLDRIVPNCPCDTVRVNTYDAIVKAAETLIQCGHTHISCFQNSPYLSTCAERLSAYESVMHRFNLHPDVIPLDAVTYIQLEPFMEQALKNGATALIAFNHLTTTALGEYCYKYNLSVGHDIELVGFQDLERPSILLQKAALVRQPVLELGRSATLRLLDRLNEPDLPVREIVLQASYVPYGEN